MSDRELKHDQPWRPYNDPRWPPLAARVLREEPRCACGCGQASEVADHKIPARDRPDLAFERSNLQAMTRRCHNRKTARENRFGGAHD